MKIGRNDPCHCGSGKKYKNCHQKAAAEGKGDWSKSALYVIAALLVLGAGGFVYGIVAGPDDGRIWSAEHGHWHNADGTELGTSQANFVPQPPGPAPEGQVWSSDHGHWHDAATGLAVGGAE
ncbi:SEC-C metal-binding domain-containing protein [Vulgatibacter sp.]|uniref:SEC-C metal-binding domain-containing protein n=1 Tax=Vulgatibacter sp. TaxID=1971226 RepID=UPI0035668DE6